jgi:hypothetical protein
MNFCIMLVPVKCIVWMLKASSALTSIFSVWSRTSECEVFVGDSSRLDRE